MKLIRRTVLILLLTLAGLYAADYLIARMHPLGSVTVHPYYAVPQKNGRTEFLRADPEVDSCVNSLLPHMGLSPCWKLRRNLQKRIDM